MPLCFSDATALTEELVCFSASAEGEEDGDIHGSVVGTISDDGSVRRLRTIDPRWKVEGVHATIDTGVIDFLFVCDQDDPDTPSPLLARRCRSSASWTRAGPEIVAGAERGRSCAHAA